MARTRASAKQAGARMERQIADYLRDELGNPAIDRMVKSGSYDRGDVGNVRDHIGRLIAVEVKNTAKMSLPAWTREAAVEAENYGAHVGVVVHKRHGVGDPGKQWVTCTLDDLIALLKETP